MSSVTLRYKRIKLLKDKGFDVGHIKFYTLSIYLGVSDCQIGVLDSRTSRMVFFEDYVFSRRCLPKEHLPLLKALFRSHPFLNAGFWKSVFFAIKNEKFAQIPASLFIEKDSVKYLKMTTKVNQEKILYFRHKRCNAVTVFSICGEMVNWIKGIYKNSTVHFTHQVASLIEGACVNPRYGAYNPLCIYVDRFKLHIVLTQNGKLIYYNQFVVKEFADYIKYIMLVLKAMKMDAETSHIILWGYIKEKSPHLAGFSKYIRNVSLGNRPAYLKFGHVFDEVENHNYFDLYSGYLSLY